MRALTLTLIALALLGCEEQRRWPHPTSPSGQRRLIEAAQAEGIDVELFIGDVETLCQDHRSVIILDHARVSPEAWARLRDWTRRGGHLIVATRTAPRPDWVGVTTPAFKAKTPRGGALRFEGGEGWVPKLKRPKLKGASILEDAQGEAYMTSRELMGGRITLLAGEDLLTNLGITFADNLELSARLFADAPAAIVASWSLHEGASRGLSLKGSPAFGGILHLGAALLVLVIGMGIRLGRPRPEAPPARRAYVEHVEALGERAFKARDVTHFAQIYAAFTLERLGARHGSAERLAEQVGRPPAEVQALLARLADAAEVPPYERAACLRVLREAAALLHDAQAPMNRGKQ